MELEGNVDLPIQYLNKHPWFKRHCLKSKCPAKTDIMDNWLIALRLYERIIERILLTLYCPVNMQSRKQKVQDKKKVFNMLSHSVLVALHPHFILMGYTSMIYNALFFLGSGTQPMFKPQSRHWANPALPLHSRHGADTPKATPASEGKFHRATARRRCGSGRCKELAGPPVVFWGDKVYFQPGWDVLQNSHRQKGIPYTSRG